MINGAQGLGLTCWFLVVERNEGMARTHCFLEGHRGSVSRYILGESEASRSRFKGIHRDKGR